MAKRKKPKVRKSGGTYICVLCKKGFTRRATVKDPHFASCVKRLGNPKNLPWDAHQSCWSKRGTQEPGPSGTVAPGLKGLSQESGGEGDVTEGEADDSENGMAGSMSEGVPDVRNFHFIDPTCRNSECS